MMVTHREKIDSFQKRHGFFKPHLVLEQWDEKLNDFNHRLKLSIKSTFNSQKRKVDSLQDKILLLNPDTQLERGFAIATDSNNNIIYSPDQVQVNDDVRVQVARGIIKTKVKEGKVQNV